MGADVAGRTRARIGRSGPPAVGAPNCTGDAVALAFAREGADVLISYLGSEEVDADEDRTLIESAGSAKAFGHHLLRTAS